MIHAFFVVVGIMSYSEGGLYTLPAAAASGFDDMDTASSTATIDDLWEMAAAGRNSTSITASTTTFPSPHLTRFDPLDCVFFRIAATDEEKARAVRELDEQRARAIHIRDSYDRAEERAYRARVCIPHKVTVQSVFVAVPVERRAAPPPRPPFA